MNFLRKIFRAFAQLVSNEVRTAQFLFPLVAVTFFAFALYGQNEPLLGGVSHEMLNAIDGAVALLAFLAITFSAKARKYYREVGYVLIYTLNLVNVFLLYGTQFLDLYAYEFVVVYLISSLFFRSEKLLYAHAAVINIAVIVAASFSIQHLSSPFDFLATFSISQIALLILIRVRFKIETQLQESEQRYRLIAEHSFDMICVHGAQGELLFVSPSSKRLLGFLPEELQGPWPYHLLHPDDVEMIRGMNLNMDDNAYENKPFQFRLKNSEGEYMWLETIFTRIPRHKKQVQFAITQTRDIRRSKSYQAQLEDRTRELERTNADLETFAYISSHDLQEPLRIVSNYMQLLKKRYGTQLDKDALDYIEFANKGAVNLQLLIRDLLSYSRITRAEVKKELVEIQPLVDEVLEALKLQLEQRNAQVICANLSEVEADRSLLSLVIQNLILNGIKYNQSPEPKIEISARNEVRETIFCVSDNGIGIPAHQLEFIFEPFKRLHTKSDYPGTGLGLSICKRIIEKQGGKIWVVSTEGSGSQFYFSIPR